MRNTIVGAAWRLAAALPAAALGACSAGGQYYVKPDLSAAGMAGVTNLTRAQVSASPFDLGVTFKSEGKVVARGGDTLYQLVHDDLGKRGGWAVRRIGRPEQDFAPAIAAIVRAPAGANAARPGAAPQVPRMLILVEDRPDRSRDTRVDYFLSGMSVGLYGVRKPVDFYDVTIAYRDPSGLQRVYRSHQELIYGHGSGSGQDDPPPPGTRRYDSVLAAFDHIVYESISGSRHGTTSVGQPQLISTGPAVPH